MGLHKHSKGGADDIIRILKDDGWYFCYQKGSHRMFKHPTKKGKISVPCSVTKNIYLSVMRQAGLKKGANYQDGHQ